MGWSKRKMHNLALVESQMSIFVTTQILFMYKSTWELNYQICKSLMQICKEDLKKSSKCFLETTSHIVAAGSCQISTEYTWLRSTASWTNATGPQKIEYLTISFCLQSFRTLGTVQDISMTHLVHFQQNTKQIQKYSSLRVGRVIKLNAQRSHICAEMRLDSQFWGTINMNFAVLIGMEFNMFVTCSTEYKICWIKPVWTHLRIAVENFIKMKTRNSLSWCSWLFSDRQNSWQPAFNRKISWYWLHGLEGEDGIWKALHNTLKGQPNGNF